MKAVILAAGKSTRMFPLTLDKPKPLLLLANRPLLAWNLDQLAGLVDEVIVVVGYKKEMIREVFGDSYQGIPLRYVVQEEQEGTGHALLAAQDYVGEEFLVMNGDDIYSGEDIEAIIGKKNCLLAKEVPDASKYGALLVRDGKVERIIEKPDHYVSNLINVGLYKFTRDIFLSLENIQRSPRGE
jgi:bifunctional UDP-N-acetylglucosamine pyrophosphorylase/glucosamine-1-phosphate N-acetyltransferase